MQRNKTPNYTISFCLEDKKVEGKYVNHNLDFEVQEQCLWDALVKLSSYLFVLSVILSRNVTIIITQKDSLDYHLDMWR